VGKRKIKVLFRRLTVMMLVFLFLITPLTPVFAASENKNSEQTSTDSQVSDDSSAISSEESVSLDTENLKSAKEDKTKDKTDSGNSKDKDDSEEDLGDVTIESTSFTVSQQDSYLSTQTASKQLLPKSDEISGALVYNYPIETPPGRNGMQPDLELTYNSQSYEEGSIFGIGWSINISYIERINKDGVDNLYSENYFYSSLTGELVDLGSGIYGSKVDNGEFLRYELSSNTWTVTDKSGTVYTFGQSASSRQDNPSDSSKIFKWMLEEVRDTNDNYIRYEYFKSNGQIYPDKIYYTRNGTTDGIFTVEFIREGRSDGALSYKTGFQVYSSYRIQKIVAKISNVASKQYVLAYVLGDNGYHSLLGNITKSGFDESSNETVLPSVTFEYQESEQGWTEDTDLATPLYFSISGNDNGTRVANVNTDGLFDILRRYPSEYAEAYVNSYNIDGWSGAGISMPVCFVLSSSSCNGYVADVNGDGLMDILDMPTSGEKKIFLKQDDNSLVTYSSYNISIPIGIDKDGATRLADVNGDGLLDLIFAPRVASYRKIYINKGINIGWVEDSSWVFPTYFVNPDIGTRIVDINGDGLNDIVQKYEGGSTNIYLNNGHGWSLSGWGLPFASFSDATPVYFYPDDGARFSDVNGDGLVDIIFAKFDNNQKSGVYYEKAVFINNGNGSWTGHYDWDIPTGFSLNSNYYGVELADINGDGLDDILYGFRTNDYSWDEKHAYIRNGKKADVLAGITYSKGGSSEISYKSSAQYRNENYVVTNPKLHFGINTVSEITNNDGYGNETTTTYQYEGGRYYFDANTPYDRKFSGFAKVTATDSAGNRIINYYHQGDTTNSTYGEYDDHISKAGKVYRTEITDSSGNIYSKYISKWDRYDLGNGRSFVKQVQQIGMTYDGDSTHRDSAEMYTYSNSTGNIAQVMQLGEVSASDDGTFSLIGSDFFITTYLYASNTTANILNLPKSIDVIDHNYNKIKEDIYYYDNQALGTVIKGNETKHEMWESGTSYINTQKTYDGTYGLVTQETDANGNNNAYAYDSYSLYPATITDSLNHTFSYLYDYSSGNVKQKTDSNNRITQYTYDGLDRLLEEKQPDLSNLTNLVTKTEYTYTDTSGAVSVQETKYLDGYNSVDSYIYYDGLGRKVQEKTEAEDGNYTTKDYVYNDIDLLEKESLPYFSSGSSRTTAITNSDLYINYAYDSLYRITSTTDSVGTVTSTYDDWKTTITDKNGIDKDIYKDAFDNLIEVDEHNSSSIYVTTYDYDELKNLIKITDALGNVRNFTYDGLGRNLSSEDLHDPNDTTYGVWTYSYDNNGNIVSRTNPNSQTTNYTYDATNRILTEDYTGQTGTEVTYVYDIGTDGIGRLYSTTSADYSQINTYNPLGNISSETKTIDFNNYTTSYTYDRQGNQLTITNHDSSSVQYEYGTGGLLDNVSRKESTDLSYIDVVSGIDYAPTGQTTVVSYANGMQTTNTYDASELYRLSSKVTTIAGNEYGQSISYAYDNNGNITQLVDNSDTSSAKTVNYTYDDLNRLTSATATNVAEGQSAYSETYSYNAIGNITAKTGQGTYSYEGNTGTNYANPHAVTSIGSTTLTYDNNGNLLSKGTELSNTWDYNNRLTQSISNSITNTYSYDASGQRIALSDGTTTTIYPTNFFNTDSTTATKHIFAGNTEIAAITGSGENAVIHYTATDHLTGSNITTDSSNNQEELLDYLPFGTIRIDEQVTTYTDQIKFAGQEYDEDTGLSYMEARYYDGNIGRFISQDPVFWNFSQIKTQLLDPQSWNSYAYARNNPLINIDPTGLYNIKTGTVEKGDTPDKIVNSINKAFNIKTNWATVQDVSFYNDRFPGKNLDNIVGQSLRIGTDSTVDITKQLNGLNESRANTAKFWGKGTLALFAPRMPWDIKNSSDNILGKSSDGMRDYWSYVYNGQLIRYDAPGNINYGYVARAAGLSGVTIQAGAIAQQVGDDLFTKGTFSFSDNNGDAKYVQMGINSYNSKLPWWQRF